MPPRAARKKNAIPAAPPVAGGSRLEQLPAELIQSIFHTLHNPSKYKQRDLIRPLSKHLCPFSTAALYRQISIHRDVNLGYFCSAISNPATAALVIGINLHGKPVNEHDMGKYAGVFERILENSLLSLKNLKRLEVGNWDIVGKVVLSSRFGREGGKALESIKMVDCFGSIEGSLTEAWSRLRHLPVLSSIEYGNSNPSIAAVAGIPSKLGGFEKVIKLECVLHDFSSSHSTNFASLLPSTLQQIVLVHLNEDIRPNYSPFLDSLSPDSINSITLTQLDNIKFASLDQFPIHESLTRFPRLQDLKCYHSRIFDSELIEAVHGLHLTTLAIYRNCKLSYDLMHQLLSGIKDDSNLKYVGLGIAMKQGLTGRTYQDGARPVVGDAGNLIPGEGWEIPDWSIITLLEARELERISIKKRVELDGPITWGLKVERAFEEEVKWLEPVMKFMRTGRVECTDCGKKN